ncbi:MAG: TetR/AcrR family transcriptional regulator [Actinomycetota bacterium]
MAGTRNKPDEARRAILEAAQRHLREGGPDAVKVQRIAGDLGLTDAAIHYHFKNRQNLLTALIRHAGVDLKQQLAETDATRMAQLAEELHAVYDTDGYARLAMWLSFAGWEDEGSGMFADVVERRAAADPGRDRTEVQYEVAFLNLVLAAEPLLGAAFLRSVGLPDDEDGRRRFHRWIVERLDGSDRRRSGGFPGDGWQP